VDRVVVRADDNVAPLIETRLLGATLVIGVRAGASYRTRTDVQVRLQARRLNGVVLRGSGEVRVDRVDTDVFEATLQGSGDIVVDALRAGAGGGVDRRQRRRAPEGHCDQPRRGGRRLGRPARRRAARPTRWPCASAAAAEARVHAIDELKVEVDGSGDVHYRGAPEDQQDDSRLGIGDRAALGAARPHRARAVCLPTAP